MFLKRNLRRKNDETYECWTLVETVRTLKGLDQCTVCHLGKLPGLDKRHRQSWKNITYLLDGEESPEVHADFEDSLQSDNNRGKDDQGRLVNKLVRVARKQPNLLAHWKDEITTFVRTIGTV